MLADIIFQLFIIGITWLGIQQLYKALTKWRVLVSARFWPQTEAKLQDKQVVFKESSTMKSNDDLILDTNYYHSVERNWLYTKVVRRDYYPEIKFRYAFAGQEIETDNLAHYNRRLFYSDKAEVEKILEQYSYSSPFTVRHNPQKAGEVFMGVSHFPIIWAVLQTVIGLFLSIGLAITAEFIFTLIGIPEPRWHDRSVVVYLIPLVAAAYLFVTVIMAAGRKT